LFDLSIATPDVLFESVIEVNERVTLVGYASTRSGINVKIPESDPSYVQGLTGEWIQILQKPELTSLEQQLVAVKKRGIASLAIAFMHSYTFPDHELQVENLARSLGFTHITLSSRTSPMIKLVPRGITTTADAYLTPAIHTYLASFFAGFDPKISSVRVEFMQSDGGLVNARNFNGFRAILSGPAAGVVGFAATSWEPMGKAVIGFDMGGTSTDVARFDGAFSHVYETTTAGVVIHAPQLDINTVAAGGGSILAFRYTPV
jgi:5-oxoprolinase (ATP-hydrolysing)